MRDRLHCGAHSIAADSSELRGKQSTHSGLDEAKLRQLAQVRAAAEAGYTGSRSMLLAYAS
jgi:hypothetical protein